MEDMGAILPQKLSHKGVVASKGTAEAILLLLLWLLLCLGFRGDGLWRSCKGNDSSCSLALTMLRGKIDAVPTELLLCSTATLLLLSITMKNNHEQLHAGTIGV